MVGRRRHCKELHPKTSNFSSFCTRSSICFWRGRGYLSHSPQSARLQQVSGLGVAPLSKWTVTNYSLKSLMFACRMQQHQQSQPTVCKMLLLAHLWSLCPLLRAKGHAWECVGAQLSYNNTGGKTSSGAWELTTGLKSVNTKAFGFQLNNLWAPCFQALLLQLQGKKTLVVYLLGNLRFPCNCFSCEGFKGRKKPTVQSWVNQGVKWLPPV